MANKYRHNKIKQEHTIIEDILPLLEDIAISKLIKSVIPGRINRRKGSGTPAYIQLKYNTRSGIKLIAKNSKSLQEIFVVTDHPDKTMTYLKKLEFIK